MFPEHPAVEDRLLTGRVNWATKNPPEDGTTNPGSLARSSSLSIFHYPFSISPYHPFTPSPFLLFSSSPLQLFVLQPSAEDQPPMRLMIMLLLVATTASVSAAKARIEKLPFGKTAEGIEVDAYLLTNASGAQVKIITYGARVVSIEVPDRRGVMGDVALGFDDLAGYVKDTAYIGAVVGRYGNRIALGKFALDGKLYTLAINNAPNHLHGGVKGFDRVVWTPKGSQVKGATRLQLTYVSKDGEESYPGNLTLTVIYTWTDRNELKMQYTATTDKATVLNPTNHAYFNLAGAAQGDILGHLMHINAVRFTPTTVSSIPTGELRSVKGTPMDFTKPTAIGARIDEQYEQLISGQGYDHNFILNKPAGQLGLAAEVYEPTTGRVLRVLTTEPGVQLYSGNFLNGATGKDGTTYPRRSGFCLEAQHYPDSPNQPAFPTTILRPGKRFSQTTIYQFSARE
jgi:aldose 1-epimerase